MIQQLKVLPCKACCSKFGPPQHLHNAGCKLAQVSVIPLHLREWESEPGEFKTLLLFCCCELQNGWPVCSGILLTAPPTAVGVLGLLTPRFWGAKLSSSGLCSKYCVISTALKDSFNSEFWRLKIHDWAYPLVQLMVRA